MVGLRSGRRTAGIALLALAVLLTGCSGLSVENVSSADDVREEAENVSVPEGFWEDVRSRLDELREETGTNAPTDTPTPSGTDTPTPTSTATPTDTPSPTEAGTDSETATPTATGTPGGDDVTTLEDLERVHRRTLQEAGSFTRVTTSNYSINATFTDSGSDTQTARIDLESGEAFVDGFTGTERYRNASGAVVTRQGSGDTATYLGPAESDSINLSSYLTTDILSSANASRVTLNEGGSVAGHAGTVYSITTVNGSTPSAENGTIPPGEYVETIEFTAVLDEEGYVSWTRFHYVNETVNTTLELVDTTRYTDVGSTTVTEPAWLPDAIAAINQPEPDDVVTRTYNATGDKGTVEMTVTGRYGDLDGSDAGVEIVEDPSDSTAMNQSRNGSIARLNYPSDGVHNVTITFTIPEEEVPDVNQTALENDFVNQTVVVIAYYNQTVFGWDAVDNTSIAMNQTISVTIEDPAQLRRLRGKVFTALDIFGYYDRIGAEYSTA